MNIQRFSKWVRLPVVLGLVFAAGHGLVYTSVSYAGPGLAMELPDGYEQTVTGTFDGLSLKEKRIWISDMVYLLDGNVKVTGTSTKLGLITDLKQGEVITATLRPNEKGHTPYIVEIIRQ